MATIYLSYKSEERSQAEYLASCLQALGHRPVYDAVSLNGGTDWRQVLMQELRAADAVVVLLSEKSLGSHFVMGEIGAARALAQAFDGRLLLLPVILDPMPIPLVISDLFAISVESERDPIVEAARKIDLAIQRHLDHTHGLFPRIFISHRHQDVAVASALVRLLEAAFVIKPTDMRCTSVSPYRLRAGARTADRLRAELGRAEAVLGILTPDTAASSYVLFELGASWGRSGVTFPLLARGATRADVPAPIGDLHTLSLDDPGDCHQLLDDLADVVTLPRRDDEDPVPELVGALMDAARAAR